MKIRILIASHVLLLPVVLWSQVVPTNEWMSFWSDSCTINNVAVPVGSIVRAYDPDGVQCGEFVVTIEGSYGLMPVYRDDPLTPADEGALPGDMIRLTINHTRAVIKGNSAPVWIANGEVRKIRLAIETDIVATNEWASFWSDATTFDGDPIHPGDVVDVYDPQGVHCGTITVTSAGSYGLLPVYRDDQTTPTIDEGANPGDSLVFKINGRLAVPLGPGMPTWTSNGSVTKLNLAGVNRLPSGVRLVSPATGTIVQLRVPPTPITFTWKRGIDPDNDMLQYTLRVFGPGLDTSLVGLDSAHTSNVAGRFNPSSTYRWTVRVSDGYGTVSSIDTFEIQTSATVTDVSDGVATVPVEFDLSQNYPNPFNPSTTIRYALPAASHVRLRVFNSLGQQIAELVRQQQNAGWQSTEWIAVVPSGVYFYRIEAVDVSDPSRYFVETRRMVLVR